MKASRAAVSRAHTSSLECGAQHSANVPARVLEAGMGRHRLIGQALTGRMLCSLRLQDLEREPDTACSVLALWVVFVFAFEVPLSSPGLSQGAAWGLLSLLRD